MNRYSTSYYNLKRSVLTKCHGINKVWNFNPRQVELRRRERHSGHSPQIHQIVNQRMLSVKYIEVSLIPTWKNNPPHPLDASARTDEASPVSETVLGGWCLENGLVFCVQNVCCLTLLYTYEITRIQSVFGV